VWVAGLLPRRLCWWQGEGVLLGLPHRSWRRVRLQRFLVAAATNVRFPVPFLCERVGIPVGGCFDGAAGGGSSDYCSVWSLASWSTMAGLSSLLLPAELLIDIRSTISIRLDNVSG
jgi:hypothetical protein